MKKLLACFISAGLLFTMSGCSKSGTQDAIDATVKGLNNLKNMESASYQMGMEMNFMGETLNIDVHGGYLEKDNKLHLSILLDVKDGETTENVGDFYMKDDTLFMQLEDSKTKLPLGDVLNQWDTMTTTPADTPSTDITSKDLIPYITEGKLDGNKVELTLESKAIQEALQKTLDEQGATTGYTYAIEVNSAVISLDLKDDYIIDARLVLDTSMGINMGQGADMNTDMIYTFTCSFTDMNANKEIEFPTFGEEYQETSIMELLGLLGQEL